MLESDSPWEGPLSTSLVVAQLRAALFGASADRASNEALQAESIRVALWALSVLRSGSTLADASVPTRQILAQARALWLPFHTVNKGQPQKRTTPNHGSGGETELERELLDVLQDQGDICSLPGGFWLPAPLRLVPLAKATYLLVGGVPTHLLPETLLEAMRLRGSFRLLERTVRSGSMPTSQSIGEWQFQTRTNWLGPTAPTLEQLIQKFRTQEMQQVSHDKTASATFEAYAAYLNKPQFQRWLPLNQLIDGRYLLRTQNLWGWRQFSLGDIQGRRLVRQSVVLQFIEIRRLCYALDFDAGAPTAVIWERKQGRLVLRNELPARERKLLATIGSLLVPREGYYPREWTKIAAQHTKIVDEILEQLHIRVECGAGR